MLVEAKSNLAKLMASENLFVEQKNVDTAYFDLKSRILTIPMLNGNLSSELYDLLLGHEVGHALETPEKGWHDSIIDLKVNKSILNVCEDVRIEKKIKRKFPGIRISFLKGYKELLDMDFFGVKGKDLNKLNFIDRINLYTKAGAAQGIEFTPEETVILREVETTETFEEVVTVARKIQDLMQIDQEQQQQTIKKKLTIVVGQGEPKDGKPVEKLNIEDYDEVEIIQAEDAGDGDGEKSDEESEGSPSEEGDSDKDSKVSSSGQMPSGGYTDSMTDNFFRKTEKKLHSKEIGKEIVYSNIPELRLDDIIISHKELYAKLEYTAKTQNQYNVQYDMGIMRANYNKFRVESNKVVSYLVKEFELRKNADKQARAQVSKTGELNMSKLHDYKFTDDIFKRMTKVPNGKSHGLVMYIDWSGSMCDHINSTIKQLLNLSLFCRKVNIPFEVYAFSSHSKSMFDSGSRWKTTPKYEVQNPKSGDICVKEFSLLNILSSKMNTKQFTDAASYLLDFGTGTGITHYCTNYYPPEWFSLSGTPLNQAIISAFRMVQQFKDDNRLEIVNTVFLTDGEGESLTYRYSQRSNYGTWNQSPDVLPTSRSRAILRDTTTRGVLEYDYKLGIRCWSTMQTTALLKMLKQRLDCNLIGFYVCNARDARSVASVYSPGKTEKISSEFKQNSFALIENSGYDDYYLLRSDKLDTDDIEFEVTNNTTRGLVSSFSKYTGGKIGSRVVLNRFINLIA